MIAIDDNFKISENGGTGNATIFVSATDKNLFSTASTQVEVSTSVGGNIKRYVTLNKKAAHGYMYTPVEWVSNENLNSDCWIDLGYVWNNNSRAQFKGAYGTSNGNEWFGERITNWNSNGPVDDDGDLRWMYNNSTRIMMWDVPSGKRVEKTSYTPSTPFELEIGNFYIKNLQTGSNLVTGSTYNVSRTNTVGLFSASGARGVIDKIKFYYVKIYEGNTLIMDIIPVLDKDNIPCFFDKVGEQFYYYKVNGVPSTGLTAGSAIQELDYYQGDGTDYVDIGYVPNASTSIELEFEGDSGDLFGATNSGAGNGMFGYFGGGSWNWRYANRYGSFPQSTFSGRALYKMTPSGDYVNNVQKNSWSGSWSNISASFYIFGIHRESTGLSGGVFNGKIYGVKIFEGDTVVREYIPAKVGSTRGFYDKVLGNFYPSNSNSLIDGNILGNLTVSVIYDESDITINNDTPSTAINVGTTFNLNTSTSPTGATLSYSSSDTSIATVDSNGVVTAVAEGTAIITITAQGFQDNTNHIYYNTTSKTVSVECAAIAYMYTPVEWVSNENINLGTIDLGYTIKTNTRMQFKVDYVTKVGACLIGEENTNSTNNYKWFSVGNKMYYDINALRLEPTWSATSGEFELGNYYIKDLATGSNMASTNSWSGTRTSTLRIFAPRSQGEDKGRFYYFKIYEDDTLVMDLIPVLDMNNIPCFFDKVGEQFYYYKVNGETSTGLTAGGAIAEYSYIDNGGATLSYHSYIPINYVWKTNSRAVMSLKVQSAQNGHLFSDEDGSNRLRLYPATGNQFKMEYRGTTITSSSRIWSNVQNIEIGNYYIKDTDTGNNIATGATKTDNQTTYCFLFGYEDKIQYYSVKIYEGDTLVCDLVPAMANNGNKGFWDKKRCQFFFDRENNNDRLYVGTKVQDIVVIKDYTQSDITISNNTPSTAITYGNTFSLGASTTPTGATLSYSSSDTSIATVDNSGVVTAVGKGNATITITAQGFNDDANKVHYNTTSKTVTVECAYQSQQIVITNSTPSEAINPNDTFDLNASTTPTGITLTYSSSDTSVATVNSNGVITGVATGTTTITISAQGFNDDVNHITYTSASTTVSVTVGEVSFNPLTDSGYFVVKALSNTKVTFAGKNTRPTIQYRINGASSWHYLYLDYEPTYDDENYHISLNEGDYAEIKGDITNDYEANPSTTLSDISLVFYCNTPNSIEIGGYLTALNQNEEINQTNNKVTVSYQYRYLFNGCTGLVSAQYLKLSDNTTKDCYQRLFYKCSNLVTPPQQIQVSNLAENAFLHSFYACTSLTSVPVLPATHIGNKSYGAMFRKCTSLTTVSLLSPRTFDSEACRQMFMDCTNLTSLSMGFSEYDSSTQALNEILSNVTTTGTFYCPSNATYSASDIGLPSTWTLSKTL